MTMTASNTSCAQCYGGWYLVSEPTRLYGGKLISRAYACLCAAGRAKLKVAQGVERALPADEIDRLWPEGGARMDLHLLDALTRANVPPACATWTLDSYRGRFGQDKKAADAVTRAARWLQTARAERSDWIVFGPNGTGKTGFVIALLRACLERGETIQFWTVKHLSILWRASYDRPLIDHHEPSPREADLLAGLVAPDVLVLDEFGGTALTDFIESTITLIVDQRQKQQRPTLLTVNLAAGDVDRGKKAVGARINALFGPTLSDRLKERAQWLALFGASKRHAWGRRETPDHADHSNDRAGDD